MVKVCPCVFVWYNCISSIPDSSFFPLFLTVTPIFCFLIADVDCVIEMASLLLYDSDRTGRIIVVFVKTEF